MCLHSATHVPCRGTGRSPCLSLVQLSHLRQHHEDHGTQAAAHSFTMSLASHTECVTHIGWRNTERSPWASESDARETCCRL